MGSPWCAISVYSGTTVSKIWNYTDYILQNTYRKFHSNPIWLVVEPYPSEKYEFVSWDDDIPNIWKNKNHVPNHQSANISHVMKSKGNNCLETVVLWPFLAEENRPWPGRFPETTSQPAGECR